MRQEIYSVGIDIGTSTTKLIFSKIILENMANAYSVPRISIINKEVVYRGEIYATPLTASGDVDAERLKKIVSEEYKKANFKPKDLSTGAVIITGETARKKNAEEALAALSDMAGDFVVATAGPDLESVLAARGAGTDILSREKNITAANVDIGGGTSNIAVYRNGNLLGVSCLDVGGRLIKLRDKKIIYVYDRLQKLLEKEGLHIKEGGEADVNSLKKACGFMACHLAQALNLKPRSGSHASFYTNQGKALPADIHIDTLTFSGGVADCMAENSSELFRYGDIGALLARAIRAAEAFKNVKILNAKETIRATVVGAGTHTTSVSGSTISYSEKLFPIKNIPALKISKESEGNIRLIEKEIRSRLPMFYPQGRPELVAIALEGRGVNGFKAVRELGEAITAAAEDIYKSGFPLVVILEADIAKALGNTLRATLGSKASVVCLDGVSVNDGDYIDIGEPLVEGSVVPVVTKTLIFNN